MCQEDIKASENFFYTLEWMLAIIKRYFDHFQFGLAHIDFQNPKILGETYGAKIASQKLDEISRSLRKAFRKTDLVARDGVGFWILVPYTPSDEKLVDKIKYIIETASQCGLQIVERDISFFSLSRDVINPCEDSSARGFLAYLKKNHLALARHKISLQHSD